MKQSSRYPEKEKRSKLMLKCSIPCVLSMLVGAFYNTTAVNLAVRSSFQNTGL